MQQHLSAFGNDAALGIGDNKANGVLLGRTLHQIGLQPKPCLTGAGTADNQHVFVPCGTGIGGTVVHGQAFRLGENDVILKGRIDIGGDVGGGTPPGGTVLLVVPKFLGVLAFDIHSQPHGSGNADSDTQVSRMEAGRWRGKRIPDTLHHVQCFPTEICSGGHPNSLSELRRKQGDKKVRNIGNQNLFPVFLSQRSNSFFFSRFTPMDCISSLNNASFARTEGRLCCFTVFAVYSLKAAVMASASCALKKTR